MSRDASVTMAWGDGEYTFRLPIKLMRDLQEKCDAGPQEILRRLQSGTWRIDDVREPLRLGLIGGNKQMANYEVLKLIIAHVDDRPWAENVPFASVVMMAALFGAPDEDAGKKKPTATRRRKGTNSPTENSPSEKSTDQPTPSGSIPES